MTSIDTDMVECPFCFGRGRKKKAELFMNEVSYKKSECSSCEGKGRVRADTLEGKMLAAARSVFEKHTDSAQKESLIRSALEKLTPSEANALGIVK